jgi:hypothetical protein
MRHALTLTFGLGLLVSAPAGAQTFYGNAPPVEAKAYYPGPAAELGSGDMDKIAPPSPAQQRQTLAAAKLPAQGGSGNVTPNGPPTANPPGAGASSAATLQEHGEVAGSASPNGDAGARR